MKTLPRLRPLSATLASALAVIMIPGCATVEPAGGSATNASVSAAHVIRGSVVYREKVALPDDAELVMELIEVSRPDRPVKIATNTIPTAGRQVPLPFTLPFDPARTAVGGIYSLHATIRYGGKTRFVTGTRVNIDVKALPLALTMLVVAGEAESTAEDSPAPSAGPNRGGPAPGTMPGRGMAPPGMPRPR
ncbi:MAG: YbaY family lipoprotein [Burkholderiales bacterium]|nr:YbaY family lipoprotein [Burkholderiales bacterium]